MSLVERKNLRAKKGKKNWRRNIDVSGLETEIENQKQQAKLEKEAKEQLKNKPLFYIDEKPDTKRQRTPLDPNRFKKKVKELTPTEAKAVSKLQAKLQRKEEVKIAIANARIPNGESIEEDAWDEEDTKPNSRAQSDDMRIPAILRPHEGQSYNPTFKAHKDLMELVVEEEIKKDKRKNENPEFERNKKSDLELRRLIQSRKERKEAREKAARKTEKKQAHDIMYLKKIKREIEDEEEEHRKILEERERKEKEVEKMVEEGKIIRTKKLNRNKYQYPGTDFQTTSELKANLRSIKVTGSLARERFDSIFRRNLIEKTSYEKKKKRKTRIPKFKFHNTERGQKDDDDKIQVHK